MKCLGVPLSEMPGWRWAWAGASIWLWPVLHDSVTTTPQTKKAQGISVQQEEGSVAGKLRRPVIKPPPRRRNALDHKLSWMLWCSSVGL